MAIYMEIPYRDGKGALYYSFREKALSKKRSDIKMLLGECQKLNGTQYDCSALNVLFDRANEELRHYKDNFNVPLYHISSIFMFIILSTPLVFICSIHKDLFKIITEMHTTNMVFIYPIVYIMYLAVHKP
jgi:hypothetical protein